MRAPDQTIHIALNAPPDGSVEASDIRQSLSAIVRVGRHLFLGCDETATLERVTDLGDGRFGEHRTYKLADVLNLPAGTDDEVDVEGLGWDPPYLWLVGSHSRKRRKAKGGMDFDKASKELADVDADDNRYLLARIPLEEDAEAGGLVPRKSCPDPRDPSRTLAAARLRGDGRRSELIRELKDDPHLRRFIRIPGKDNGLDVEGIQVAGGRVLLGLRGPVLRGWAVVLQVEPVDAGDEGRLKLRKIGKDGRRYRKHFLDLNGLGIRDLAQSGDDLLILAGPTMDVRAHAGVFRWRGGLRAAEESLVSGDALEQLTALPHDVEGGADHPEGMCRFDDGGSQHSLLVAYDSPSGSRQDRHGVTADVFALPSPGVLGTIAETLTSFVSRGGEGEG
ncbi:MAG TPA: DUF3616 domain-containing protein [Longimicrobium sp.]|nr:DUF3616 domain-containing protein [Longimicrobium sp.]